jgi:hypothetical protein
LALAALAPERLNLAAVRRVQWRLAAALWLQVRLAVAATPGEVAADFHERNDLHAMFGTWELPTRN